MTKNRHVLKVKFLEDEVGVFLPICTSQYHRGLIINGFRHTCEQRQCTYYMKYRQETNKECLESRERPC